MAFTPPPSHVSRSGPLGPQRGLVLIGGPRSFLRPSDPPFDRALRPSDPRFRNLERVRVRFRRLVNGFGDTLWVAQVSCLPGRLTRLGVTSGHTEHTEASATVRTLVLQN